MKIGEREALLNKTLSRGIRLEAQPLSLPYTIHVCGKNCTSWISYTYDRKCTLFSYLYYYTTPVVNRNWETKGWTSVLTNFLIFFTWWKVVLPAFVQIILNNHKRLVKGKKCSHLVLVTRCQGFKKGRRSLLLNVHSKTPTLLGSASYRYISQHQLNLIGKRKN